MGFLTRLIAGLVAASTLGAGLAGTAGAVDTTGATGDAKGVVKLASDDTTNGTVKTVADENVRYGSLANGDFSYPSFSDIHRFGQGSSTSLPKVMALHRRGSISHTGWSFDWNNPSMNYLYHRTFLCPVPYVHKVGIRGKNQKFPRLRN